MDLIEDQNDDDREIAQSDAKLDREKRVAAFIHETFTKLGLPVADAPYAISYEEEYGREAVVVLEDEPEGFSIKLLSTLYGTGLSNDFRVASSSSNNIEIRFVLDLAAVRSRLMT